MGETQERTRGSRERVEDLEDAKELDAAINRNAEKPLVARNNDIVTAPVRLESPP